VDEAFRIVRPGGRIVILDLLRHQFEEAREMYADVMARLHGIGAAQSVPLFLKKSGFRNVQTAIVHREPNRLTSPQSPPWPTGSPANWRCIVIEKLSTVRVACGR
jgi:SAM-dependent methyltransferase